MTSPRGFTLLIAILLATVAVTIGAMLLDISYKQVVLASNAKQSQFAFYSADAALECALYYDQRFNAFSFSGTTYNASNIECGNVAVANFVRSGQTGSGYSRHVKTTFNIQCPTGGSIALVTVYKYVTASTTIYANGYSTCSDTDPRRVERGLKVFY